SSCAATMVVTASGGILNAAPCAIAVWICRNFTKPRAATITIVAASVTSIRFNMFGLPLASPSYVDQQAAIDSVAVPRPGSEEVRSGFLRLHRDEPIVAAHSPASVEPLHAAADVPCEERFGVRNVEARLVEERDAANAAGHVRRDRAPGRQRHDDV